MRSAIMIELKAATWSERRCAARLRDMYTRDHCSSGGRLMPGEHDARRAARFDDLARRCQFSAFMIDAESNDGIGIKIRCIKDIAAFIEREKARVLALSRLPVTGA